MVLSDESWFYVEDNIIRCIRRYGGGILSEEYPISLLRIKNPKKIMIWEAISYERKRTMQFIDGSLDSSTYIKILIINCLHLDEPLSDECYFQQDNATPYSNSS